MYASSIPHLPPKVHKKNPRLGKFPRRGAVLYAVEVTVQPGVGGGQGAGEDAGEVGVVFALVEFEDGFAAGEAAEDFDFAFGVAHGVADGLAEAVLAGFGSIHDADALLDGDLEALLDAGDGAALEDRGKHSSYSRTGAVLVSVGRRKYAC